MMLKDQDFIKYFHQIGSQWNGDDKLLGNSKTFVCLIYGPGTCKSVNQLMLIL